jgi:twitching motility two-component system response regulator PilG
MQGTLNEIDIRSILQLIELGQRTGELFVETYSSPVREHQDGSLTPSSKRYFPRSTPGDTPSWFVFFANGKIVYAADRASSSLSRLQDYLRYYRAEEAIADLNSPAGKLTTPEYAYLWQLMENRIITPAQGRNIIYRTIAETLFDLLGLHKGIFNFEGGVALAPQLTTVEIEPLVVKIVKQVQQWKQFHPHIQSPSQCPILSEKIALQAALPHNAYKSLDRWADGKTSLRQLSRFLNRDISTIARAIYPYIQKGWIQMLDGTSAADRPRYAPESPQTLTSIVCLDDDLTIGKSVEFMLQSQGYRVIVLTDSLEAIGQVFRLKPDLILCDIAMPDLDGYEICAMLRSSTRFRQTPIIMLTGKDGFIDRVRARLVGATDYLTKPFGAGELLMLIQKYLGWDRGDPSPDKDAKRSSGEADREPTLKKTSSV